jgi:SAM-dependent methyltransferase
VVPILTSFETAHVGEGEFDLAVAATSFHWLDREVAPRKLGASLRPDGWLALFWNVFGDPREPDPFHEATKSPLSGLAASPSSSTRLPFALDRRARRADFQAARCDRNFEVEELRWRLTLSAPATRSLYQTFSRIARLPEHERNRLLDAITSVAELRFGGVVERCVVTPVYLGRREA